MNVSVQYFDLIIFKYLLTVIKTTCNFLEIAISFTRYKRIKKKVINYFKTKKDNSLKLLAIFFDKFINQYFSIDSIQDRYNI